jgi:hypothetical protein
MWTNGSGHEFIGEISGWLSSGMNAQSVNVSTMRQITESFGWILKCPVAFMFISRPIMQPVQLFSSAAMGFEGR